MLNMIEVFSSVQGETSFTGWPTVFLRLAACNLRCSWCDTTYSFGRGTPWSVDSLIQKALELGCQHVCVTGGEPLLQPKVHALMSRLCDLGKIVSLETSGSLSMGQVDPRVHVILDIKCPGSGMAEKNLWDNMTLVQPHHEIKCVLLDRADYEYACKKISEHRVLERTKQILMSPVSGHLDPKVVVEWILQDNLPFRLNLQTHKFIWSPDTKGV